MDLIHYVVKDGVLDSAAHLGDTISPMDQHGANEVGCFTCIFCCNMVPVIDNACAWSCLSLIINYIA
jgi:hypothetical protein